MGQCGPMWHSTPFLCFFCTCIIIINNDNFLAYKFDGRLYFNRNKRDEESQGKMQETGQLEMGGANIINSLHCLVSTALGA